MEQEGVIKFDLRHESADLIGCDIGTLAAWRLVLKRLGLLGQDPSRYDGYGFGNVSMRSGAGFIISGTQTGERDETSIDHYAEITSWNLDNNRVESRGRVKPSSESLTHASIYELSPRIAFVFHVHSPDIWRAAKQMRVATTPPDVAYGTPAMAAAVRKACGEVESGSVAMAGHEDGVITFGPEASVAGNRVVGLLTSALQLRNA